MRRWLNKIAYKTEVCPQVIDYTITGYSIDVQLRTWVTLCTNRALKDSYKKVSYKVLFKYIYENKNDYRVNSFKQIVKKYPKAIFYALYTLYKSGIPEAKQVLLKYYGTYKYSNKAKQLATIRCSA